ncbi:MAG TPA: hypothetical protein VNI84_17000, partial [Pyrinomonadaceae bacterium]|nr:hypothetical protein [Pyrinomonadaceae bacterium]
MSDAPKFKSFADKPLATAGSFRALRSLPAIEKQGETTLDKHGQDKYGQDKYGQDKSSMDKTRQDKYGQDRTSKRVETSPTKNYTKTSNSIVKTAIPEKYFR